MSSRLNQVWTHTADVEDARRLALGTACSSNVPPALVSSMSRSYDESGFSMTL
jgi:hypothetical protein